MNFSTCLADLFRRDLSRLIQQIEAFPDDQILWATLPGTTNSAGNLTLHIEGNLREYVGRQLGGVPYARKRPLEFSLSGIQRQELRIRVEELRDMIPLIVARLSAFWSSARVVMPSGKTSVHLRLDSEVVEWFRASGKGHLTRMNAVLKAYVETHKG